MKLTTENPLVGSKTKLAAAIDAALKLSPKRGKKLRTKAEEDGLRKSMIDAHRALGHGFTKLGVKQMPPVSGKDQAWLEGESEKRDAVQADLTEHAQALKDLTDLNYEGPIFSLLEKSFSDDGKIILQNCRLCPSDDLATELAALMQEFDALAEEASDRHKADADLVALRKVHWYHAYTPRLSEEEKRDLLDEVMEHCIARDVIRKDLETFTGLAASLPRKILTLNGDLKEANKKVNFAFRKGRENAEKDTPELQDTKGLPRFLRVLIWEARILLKEIEAKVEAEEQELAELQAAALAKANANVAQVLANKNKRKADAANVADAKLEKQKKETEEASRLVASILKAKPVQRRTSPAPQKQAVEAKVTATFGTSLGDLL